ncbi:MAG: hypothetical protein ABGX31_02075 [bacterium]|jgi:hypothetical protein
MRQNSGDESHTKEDNKVGVFSSWKPLYLLVVVYSVVLILVLQWLTTVLDFSSR